MFYRFNSKTNELEKFICVRGRGQSWLKTAQELENEVSKMARLLDAEEVSDSDVDKGLKLIEQVHRYLERNDFDANYNCIAALGTTGVGKSTVVSLLFGKGKLLVHCNNRYSQVLVAETPLDGIGIHCGSTSKTLIPGVLKTDIEGQPFIVFDMPGCQDTRGPFAELVVHSILKWMLARHKLMHFLLVATPPQERPQEVVLVDTINRVYDGYSNAVLVYTKCDADFEPESTTELQGLDKNKRNIPAFGLTKPTKKSKEGDDYSSTKAEIRCDIRRKLICSVVPGDVLGGSVPESAQLLLEFFRKRIIASARETLSNSFLNLYKVEKCQRSLDTIMELLDTLAIQQKLCFGEMVNLLQRISPSLRCIWTSRSVIQAQKRIDMVEKWCEAEILLCKEEWLTMRCRSVLKTFESELITLKTRVVGYRHVERNEDTKTLVISGWHLRFSQKDLCEITDFVKMKHTRMNEGIPTVVLIGFATITLDIPITMWANLFVLSPNVSIHSTVNLSALGQAPSPFPSRAGPGRDGIHGAPGRYGGSFVLVYQDLDSEQSVEDLFISTGQDGGDGQNAGNGIDGEDEVYTESEFKASVEELCSLLSTLNEFKSLYSKLPCGMKVENKYAKEVPPDNKNILLGMVGAVITTAAVAISTVVPEGGTLVGGAGIALGSAMIREAFGRSTETIIVLIRPSLPGTRGKSPGCRGKGGWGGLGGDLYVIESKCEIMMWCGSSGGSGNPGRPGKSSRDGKNSISLNGTVYQQYNRNGTRVEGPSVKIQKEKPLAPREYAQTGFTADEPPPPASNSLNPVDAAEEYYCGAVKRLAKTFPHCDFEKLVMP